MLDGETNTPTIKDFITTLTFNLHSRLPLATGALFYNIGQTSIHPHLKTRLSQDLLNLRLTMLNITTQKHNYKKKNKAYQGWTNKVVLFFN
jgi:hypothetical protein